MKIFCWDESINDGSYGGNASAAIMAITLAMARGLVQADWSDYLAAHPEVVRTRHDGSTYMAEDDTAPPFYGVHSPRCYAGGIVAGVQTTEPDRVIDVPRAAQGAVILLAKGYEG